MRVDTGAGDDYVLMYEANVFGSVRVSAGAGDDSMTVVRNTANHVVLDGGRGQDTLRHNTLDDYDFNTFDTIAHSRNVERMADGAEVSKAGWVRPASRMPKRGRAKLLKRRDNDSKNTTIAWPARCGGIEYKKRPIRQDGP